MIIIDEAIEVMCIVLCDLVLCVIEEETWMKIWCIEGIVLTFGNLLKCGPVLEWCEKWYYYYSIEAGINVWWY